MRSYFLFGLLAFSLALIIGESFSSGYKHYYDVMENKGMAAAYEEVLK